MFAKCLESVWKVFGKNLAFCEEMCYNHYRKNNPKNGNTSMNNEFFSFELIKTDPETGARAGILHTHHGDI